MGRLVWYKIVFLWIVFWCRTIMELGLYLEMVLESMCKLSETDTVSEKVIEEKVEEYWLGTTTGYKESLEENMKNKYGEKSQAKDWAGVWWG